MLNQGAKILSIDQLDKLRYPLPRSLIRAAGLLKHKKIDPVKYQKKIRKEWESKLHKLERQFNKSRTA